jgi:alpha-L-fucosidase
VSSDFDPSEFARTMKRAHVNSVTMFAKCHHGMSYYPTKVGTQHPALNGRDLMGEQMEALRREGIRCPLYTTVVWEEDAAQKHPEWRQLRQDGLFAVGPLPPTTKPCTPARGSS